MFMRSHIRYVNWIIDVIGGHFEVIQGEKLVFKRAQKYIPIYIFVMEHYYLITGSRYAITSRYLLMIFKKTVLKKTYLSLI